MSKLENKKVPLTGEESEWLMKIYKLRHDDLFYAGAFRCFGYSVAICTIVTNIVSAANVAFFGGNGSLLFASISNNLLINTLLAVGVTIALVGFINHYMIEAYKLDAMLGMKYLVPFTIISKEYFPVTGQYFFRLNNNPEKLFEVDEHDYNSYEEGGIMYMNQGINSGRIFGQNDEVKVKFFKRNRQNYYSNY